MGGSGTVEDPAEAKIVAICLELLGVPSVGMSDNFFALGGNSLLAMHLAQRIYDEFGADVPAIELYEALTLSDMCDLVRKHRLSGRVEGSGLARARGEGTAGASSGLLVGALARAMRDHRLRVALRAPGLALTYGELEELIAAVASSLARQGVGSRSRAIVLMNPDRFSVLSMLALAWLGCPAIPVRPTAAAGLEHIESDAGATHLLTNSDPGARLACWSPAVSVTGNDSPAADGLAYIMYTSGSTGPPKGVAVSGQALMEHIRGINDYLQISRQDVILQFMPHVFDPSQQEIWSALLAGAALILREGVPWTPRQFWRALQEHEISVATLPTAYWNAVADSVPETAAFPPSLRLLAVGGEALMPSSLGLWEARAPERVALVNLYGPTEAVICATAYRVLSGSSASFTAGQSMPIGQPLPGHEAAVMDPVLCRAADPGSVGELWLSGLLADGYVTGGQDACFVTDAGKRWYRTGDMVRILPGADRPDLQYLGRLDDEVKIRGVRIRLSRIESLACSVEDVEQAVALTTPGPAGPSLMVAITARASHADVGKAVSEFLERQLDPHVCPVGCRIVAELPLTPNGKVDRHRLQAELA